MSTVLPKHYLERLSTAPPPYPARMATRQLSLLTVANDKKSTRGAVTNIYFLTLLRVLELIQQTPPIMLLDASESNSDWLASILKCTTDLPNSSCTVEFEEDAMYTTQGSTYAALALRTVPSLGCSSFAVSQD